MYPRYSSDSVSPVLWYHCCGKCIVIVNAPSYSMIPKSSYDVQLDNSPTRLWISSVAPLSKYHLSMLPTGITAGQRSQTVCSMKNHLPAARPEKGSWVREESPDSEAVRPTASNPPHLSLCTSVCRSLLSLFAPERLLGPLWKPWLWQRTHHARILSPCKLSDSGSRTRGLPSVCALRGGL